MANFYKIFSKLFLAFLSLSLSLSLSAQVPQITYEPELTGFTVPINIANAHDGSNRLFIPQQNGVVMVREGAVVKQFADFGPTGANIVLFGGERGLLSMAFHPEYDGVTNRFLFLYHNDLNGDVAISRCQTLPGNIDSVDRTSIINIITIPHPNFSNHNGGQLRFGPDGYLYFATGDGGSGNDPNNNAQNGDVLLGKMLRLDINNTSSFGNYAIPPDNPYVSDPNIDDRIWALGLRNPYRWSFDRLTGDMWIGDVGQGSREELDYRPAGSTGHVNYGWRCYEGYISTPGVADCTPTDLIFPVFDYPNPDSGSAVTGGFVYRGPGAAVPLTGRYIATDVYSGYLWILSPNGTGGFDSTVQVGMGGVVAFGEGEDGTLYAVTQGNTGVGQGTLYKVTGTGGVVLPVGLVNFSGEVNRGYNALTWKTSTEQSTARFYVEYSTTGSVFERAATVTATRNATVNNYSFNHYTDNKATLYYRLAIEDDNGSLTYSKIVRLSGTSNNGVLIYPTVLHTSTFNLDLGTKPVNSMRIINTNGKTVFTKDLRNISGNTSITFPTVAKGIYVVEFVGAGVLQTEKIVIE